MGRSGGGGGGRSGGFSGGGFSGGGRRSGGFSGGRRSGGSVFGGAPFGGASRHRDYGGRRHSGGSGSFLGGMLLGSLLSSSSRRGRTYTYGGGIPTGGPTPPQAAGSYTPKRPGKGCLTWIVAIVAIVVAWNVLMPLLSGSHTVATQTPTRTAISASAVTKTDYYTDADGDWIHSPSRLTRGLEEFYQRTGVQPYVYILKNGSVTSTSELSEMAEQLYDTLFQDEGHFLLVFCDDGQGSFNCGYTMGSEAAKLLDDSALGVLADELNDAYNNASSDEEVFSDAFANTAERIMSETTTTYTTQEVKFDPTPLIVLGVIGIMGALIVAGFFAASVRSARKAEQRERAEEILNTPLEKFGDKSVEDLASKYEDK